MRRRHEAEQNPLYARAAESRRSNERRNPPSRAGYCASAIAAYDVDALEASKLVDLGRLGACASCELSLGECECTDKSQRRVCTHCGALLFVGEARRCNPSPPFSTHWNGGALCCCQGKVQLPPIKRVAAIEAVWNDASLRQALYAHARVLNNALTLASAVVKTPVMPGGSHFTPSVVIQGKLHHKVGSLMTDEDAAPQYAQLYVHDPAASDTTTLDLRFAKLQVSKSTTVPEKRRLMELLTRLEAALRESNPYVRDFVTAGEIFKMEAAAGRMVTCQFVVNPDKAPPGRDKRVYSANRQQRTFDEVSVLHNESRAKRAVVLRCRNDDSELGLQWTPVSSRPSDGQQLRDPPAPLLRGLEQGTYEFTHREFAAFGVVGLQRNSYIDIAGAFFMPSGRLRNIHEDHRAYDPLHYVLLLPAGDDGWVDSMPLATPQGSGASRPEIVGG